MHKALVAFISLFVCLLFLIPSSSYAAEKFGMLFEIDGEVKVTDVAGKAASLSRSKDLLRPIIEGDRIDVAKGKAIIVSIKENRGHELLSNSTGQVKNGRLVTIKGTINAKDGLHAPQTSSRGAIGGLVLRGSKPCVTALSPVNTAVLEPSPELRWKNFCEGSKKVTITVLAEERVVFTAETDKDILRLPGGLLRYGSEYRWIIDSSQSSGITGGMFTLPAEKEANVIQEQISAMRLSRGDIAQRLSLVFYLLEKNLVVSAKEEIKALRNDFPENEHIKAVFEK